MALITSDGAVVALKVPNGGVPAGSFYSGGVAHNADGAVYIVDSTPSILWANLPAPGSVAIGQPFFVSDIGVGGSLWYSDGSRWRAVGGKVILKSNNTDITSVANTNEQILDQFLLPAGILYPGCKLWVQERVDKSGTVDTCTRRLRLGTTGTAADSMLTSNAQPATTSRLLSGDQPFRIVAATAIRPLGSGGVTWNGTSVSPSADITIPNISNALYLSYSTQMATGVETMTLKEFEVVLVTP